MLDSVMHKHQLPSLANTKIAPLILTFQCYLLQHIQTNRLFRCAYTCSHALENLPIPIQRCPCPMVWLELCSKHILFIASSFLGGRMWGWHILILQVEKLAKSSNHNTVNGEHGQTKTVKKGILTNFAFHIKKKKKKKRPCHRNTVDGVKDLNVCRETYPVTHKNCW